MTTPPRTLESRADLATSRRHYEHAPIIEAVLSINIVPPLADVRRLASLGTGEEARYPQRAPVLVMQSTFSVNPMAGQTSVSQDQRALGYAFMNPGRGVFQARLDGFAYSWLAPYDTWESFRDEASRLGSKYATLGDAGTRINRISLRYVNRLDLAVPVGELKDYLLTAPDIAPGLSQVMAGFMMQLDLPQPDLPDAVMVVREGIVAPPRPDTVSILLDIDLTQTVDLGLTDQEVWTTNFEALHIRADEAFERSITDKVRKVIR